MSADTGQVATALKTVLDKASAAAQRSGRNTKVRWNLYMPINQRKCVLPPKILYEPILPLYGHGSPRHVCCCWLPSRVNILCAHTSCMFAAKSGSSQQDQAG